MTTKQLAALALTFAAGVLVASFSYPYLVSKARPVEGGLEPSLASGEPGDLAALRTGYEREIADLKNQMETLRAQNGLASSVPEGLTYAERAKREQDARHARFAGTLQREENLLLAAGFTRDRIEWIRNRAEELAAEYRRTESLVQQQGRKVDVNAQTSHMRDPDIDLRHELGDEEYAKYRQALGRGAGMKVAEVLPGGVGDSAGLKAGDEIIAYNGTRVFNIGELNPLIVRNMGFGTPVAVDVVRNGQTIRLNVPAGDMSIRVPLPIATAQDLGRAMRRVDAIKMDLANERDASIASGSR